MQLSLPSKGNIYFITVLFFFATLINCSNSNVSEVIKKFEIPDSFRIEIAENIELQYSDSGILYAKIFADSMKRYPYADSPYLELIKNVHAKFYNKSGKKVTSSLKAEYAKKRDKSQTISVYDNVALTNVKNETLLTSELHWDQKKKKIYTEKFVTIIRNGDTLHGIGLISNESFSRYRVKKLKGQINNLKSS